MKLRSDARGVYVIAPTPFQPDGSIDASSIDRMTDFFIAAGVDGMTVLGQLGEAPKMTHDESIAIVRQVGCANSFNRSGRGCFSRTSITCGVISTISSIAVR